VASFITFFSSSDNFREIPPIETPRFRAAVINKIIKGRIFFVKGFVFGRHFEAPNIFMSHLSNNPENPTGEICPALSYMYFFFRF
jgi:hypothetical protein